MWNICCAYSTESTAIIDSTSNKKSRSKCPFINCASCTSREDLEIEILPIVVPYRSTPPPFFVDGNCVDGNWLPTVLWQQHSHQPPTSLLYAIVELRLSSSLLSGGNTASEIQHEVGIYGPLFQNHWIDFHETRQKLSRDVNFEVKKFSQKYEEFYQN